MDDINYETLGESIGKKYNCRIVCWKDPLYQDSIYICILKNNGRKCKGKGTTCLREFINKLQSHGVKEIRIDAYPMKKNPSPELVRRLVRWYEKMGFVLQHEFTPHEHNKMIYSM